MCDIMVTYTVTECVVCKQNEVLETIGKENNITGCRIAGPTFKWSYDWCVSVSCSETVISQRHERDHRDTRQRDKDERHTTERHDSVYCSSPVVAQRYDGASRAMPVAVPQARGAGRTTSHRQPRSDDHGQRHVSRRMSGNYNNERNVLY